LLWLFFKCVLCFFQPPPYGCFFPSTTKSNHIGLKNQALCNSTFPLHWGGSIPNFGKPTRSVQQENLPKNQQYRSMNTPTPTHLINSNTPPVIHTKRPRKHLTTPTNNHHPLPSQTQMEFTTKPTQWNLPQEQPM
jgi:hypothetical protein